MQLRTHPNPVVVSHTTISLELWGELQPGDVPEDLHLGQPIDALVAGLRTRLNALVDGDGAVLRLSNLVLHVLYVQRLMDLATVSTFTRLGAGSFATVFVSEGRGGAVVKQVKAPGNADLLCKEHADLETLYRECASPSSFFQLPRPFGFYNDYWTFAREANIPRTLDLGLPPHAMYVMPACSPTCAELAYAHPDLCAATHTCCPSLPHARMQRHMCIACIHTP